MKSVHLLLTRHGETIENRNHILQGQLPGTLSLTGRQQAAGLAQKLASEKIDAILCSDLARSYETAVIIGAPHGLTPVPSPLLREMDWGIYTGQNSEQVDWEHLPPSVESIQELYHRAGEWIDYLKVKYAGKRVLAVGHGAFNRALVARLEGRAPQEMVDMPIMENTSVKRFMLQ